MFLNYYPLFAKRSVAFTLIELIVVIAIIAVLAAIIAPNAFKAIEKSKVARMASDLKSIKQSVLSFYSDTGQWPVNANGTTYTWISGSHPLLVDTGVVGWNGPYLEKQAKSPTWTGTLSPGCGTPGLYYTQWYNGGWAGTYYGDFDLDKNGSYEVNTGHSISVFPLPADIRKNLNIIFDNDNSDSDMTGVLKVSSGCGGILTFYTGTI